MKDIKFNEIKMKRMWDRYEAFWKPLFGDYHGQVAVMFETGEIIFNRGAVTDVNYRQTWNELGITIFSTNDKLPFDLVTEDGGEVKPAWLKQGGGQVMLADHTRNKVVRFRENIWRQKDSMDALPRNMQHTHLHYFNATSDPIGAPVVVARPFPDIRSKETKAWLDETRALANAIYKIQGGDDGYKAANGNVWLPASPDRHQIQPSSFRTDANTYVNSLKFHDMRAIVISGLAVSREPETVPYLKIKGA